MVCYAAKLADTGWNGKRCILLSNEKDYVLIIASDTSQNHFSSAKGIPPPFLWADAAPHEAAWLAKEGRWNDSPHLPLSQAPLPISK